MVELVSAVRQSIQNENWYAALGIALALPDVCGKLEGRIQGSQARFVDWFQRYLEPKYTSVVGAAREKFVFLSGPDCYALRCAFLHEGEFDITSQKARKVIEDFIFTAPTPGMIPHMNKMGNALQLQVDIFCEDICKAVETWMRHVSSDTEISSKIKSLPKIVYPHLEGGIKGKRR